MKHLFLVLFLSLLTGCASTVRSVWRDWGNDDLVGKAAPELVGGTWLLPPDQGGGARPAPADWQPPHTQWRLIAFLQPH